MPLYRPSQRKREIAAKREKPLHMKRHPIRVERNFTNMRVKLDKETTPEDDNNLKIKMAVKRSEQARKKVPVTLSAVKSFVQD